MTRRFSCPDHEFCQMCGKGLVRTEEPAGYDPQTGEQIIEAWHSCPSYFPSPWWVNLLTLGCATFGHMGHESHGADCPVRRRVWA